MDGAAPPVPPEERRVLRIELAVMAFAASAPGLVIGLRGLDDPTSVDTSIDVVTLIAVVLAGLGPAAVAVFLLWRDGALRLAGIGRPTAKETVGWGAFGLLASFLALTAVAVVVGAILAAFGVELSSGEDPIVDTSVGRLLAALLISLSAGFGEETVYRAYGITRMEQAGLPRAALWAPWAIWTLQHLYAGPLALIVVGAVGFPWVLLFRHVRSVWPVIAAHVLYDAAIFAIVAAG